MWAEQQATGRHQSSDFLFDPVSWSRADEENESSSSEEEEEDRRRLTDELLGKVCSIEAEEDPVGWYLALVGGWGVEGGWRMTLLFRGDSDYWCVCVCALRWCLPAVMTSCW